MEHLLPLSNVPKVLFWFLNLKVQFSIETSIVLSTSRWLFNECIRPIFTRWSQKSGLHNSYHRSYTGVHSTLVHLPVVSVPLFSPTEGPYTELRLYILVEWPRGVQEWIFERQVSGPTRPPCTGNSLGEDRKIRYLRFDIVFWVTH